MQVGKGKQGVLIGEYCGPRGEVESSNTNPILGYIEPAGDNPQWILWFSKNGDAVLYTKRSYKGKDTGAVIGEPVRVKA